MLLDGLYKVINVSENEATVELCDEKHAVFKAHFPSNPILPGFVHLDIIEDAFELQLSGVKKAKFSALVHPRAILTYKKVNTNVKVFLEEVEVAQFALSFL